MNGHREIRIASAQYPVGEIGDWADYEAKLGRWVTEAAAQHADLLLFPEYAAMELTVLAGPADPADLQRQSAALQAYLGPFLDLHRQLAQTHGLYILGASFPVRVAEGRYRNRAHLFGPGGDIDFQDKLQLTRFEAEHWGLEAGDSLKVFDTALGRLGVLICYDVEFPLLARRQVEAGAELLLVPSCTDTLAGYHRVRVSGQARALENQCYVAQAVTVGQCGHSEAIDDNVGAAAIYTPIDHGFPFHGIQCAGTLNQARWVFADLDLDQLDTVRRNGQVLNHHDWPGQLRLSDTAERRSVA